MFILLVKLIKLFSIFAHMSIITIDTDKWITQQEKANNWIGKSGKPVSIQYISRLVNKGKLKSLRLDKIGIVLVER